MDIVILDLEWNAAYSRRLHKYINEVIEFGAVKCGDDLAAKDASSVLDTFSCLVRPQVGKKMNPYTAELTNLTVESLSGGLSFMAAVSKFRRWAGDCLLMTWGPSDILALIENCRYFSGREEVPFLTRYCDLQKYAQKRLGLSGGEQLGLEKAAELLFLDVSQMEHHRAKDDSLMTLEILKKVYDRDDPPDSVECDGDFYRKMTFKTSYLSDLKDPLIKPEYLRFPCPKCGEQTRRKTNWAHRNKGFRAEFRCAGCGHKFAGQLYLKQKYEGITVSKKTYPLPVIESPAPAKSGPVGNLRLDIAENGVGVLRFPFLEECKAVSAAFSTRVGGVSEKEFAAMNLGFRRGDETEKVEKNYRLFCEAAGFDPDSLVSGAQDHQINIWRVKGSDKGVGVWLPQERESVDGLCTDEPGVTLMIFTADCVPLYFVDEAHHAIGLAHAGWRGTAAGMAKAMTERMEAEFGTRPEDLRVAIGPSICQDCFEVDTPVAKEFLALDHADAFVSGPVKNIYDQEKYHVDLWECNRQFLLSAGVKPERIFVSGVCTVDHSSLLFSHRKTGGRRGSNAAFLSLR